MVPLAHVKSDVTQRGRADIDAQAVGILGARHPVILLDDVLTVAVFGMDEIIGSLIGRAHHIVGIVGAHSAQARSAVGALRIHRVGTVHEIAGTEQTAFFAHIVKAGSVFCAFETAIEDSDDDASAIVAHVVQHINIQLLHLVFCTAIETF